MVSPQVVANEPGRRIRGKSNKPERRGKEPVDLSEADFDDPTPSQQSAKSGAGTGAGRERARRMSERMPKAQGATGRTKSKDTTMMSKGVEKKFMARAEKGQPTDHLSSPENAVRKQPVRRGAKKQSRASNGNGAPAAEAAPTQKQTLKGKAPSKRTRRDEGVDASQ